MRAVIQRVKWGRVTVEDKVVGQIARGCVVLLGIGQGDSERVVRQMVHKLLNLRIFADAQDKMNLSLSDISGACLVVSQFTLYADCSKGRRPSFVKAEAPARARELCDFFCDEICRSGIVTEMGIFGAMMSVELCNDGPVTIVLDSHELGL